MNIFKKIFSLDTCELTGKILENSKETGKVAKSMDNIAEKLGNIAQKSNKELLIYINHVKNIIKQLKKLNFNKKLAEKEQKMDKNDYEEYKKLVDFACYTEHEITKIFEEIRNLK